MKTKPKTKPLTDAEKVGVLAGSLLFIIRGLIRANPIIKMDAKATEYPMVTLESEIWTALNKCGIREK